MGTWLICYRNTFFLVPFRTFIQFYGCFVAHCVSLERHRHFFLLIKFVSSEPLRTVNHLRFNILIDSNSAIHILTAPPIVHCSFMAHFPMVTTLVVTYTVHAWSIRNSNYYYYSTAMKIALFTYELYVEGYCDNWFVGIELQH